MDMAIIPECCVDTNLVETLVPPARRGIQKGYNHQKGCGTVTKVMQERFAGSFALGVIDKDKREVDYLKLFDVVTPEIITATTSLVLYKHPNRHHYIIQINPAVETFIQNCAAAASISIADYELPTDDALFRKECKREQSKADARFSKLFKALSRAKVPDIARLTSWITHLKEYTFGANIDALRAF